MSLTGKSIGVFAVRGTGIAMAFAMQVFLARLLSLEGYGNYAFAITLITLLSLVGKIGLDTAAIRFVAAYAGSSRHALLHGFVRGSLGLVTLASIGITALLIASLALFDDIEPKLHDTLLMAAIALPLLGLMQLSSGMLQGFQRTVMSQALSTLVYPALVIIGVSALTLVSGYRVDATAAMAMTALALLLTFAAGAVTVFTALRRVPRPARMQIATREWISSGFSITLVATLVLLIQQTDILMVGMLIDTEHAGIYAAANRLSMLVGFGLMVANTVFAPVISAHHARDELALLESATVRAARVVLLFTIPAALLIGGFGQLFLMLFGNEFVAGHNALMILVLGQVGAAAGGLGGFYLTMTGRHWQATRVSLGAAAANIVLNLLLIPRFGIEGAAVATAISSTLWYALISLRVYRSMGINPTAFGRYARPSIDDPPQPRS